MKNKLTIDFETRSTVDLKKAGAWKYSESPLTEIICLAVKWNDEPPKLWFPDDIIRIIFSPEIEEIRFVSKRFVSDLIEKADIIEAHNIGFERAIWKNVMVKRFGFPELPLEKCRCSAAVAARYALPRGLDKAVKALGLPQEKDKEGHTLMLKMCKPRQILKKELEELSELKKINIPYLKELYDKAKSSDFINAAFHNDTSAMADYHGACLSMNFDYARAFLRYHETPEQIVRLAQYCMQDVDTEYALSEALGELPEMELPIFLLDQKINERGIPVDLKSVDSVIKRMADEELRLLKEMETLTSGIKSPKQVAVTLHWINVILQKPEYGIPVMKNLQKATVAVMLEKGGLPTVVMQVLEIRQALSKSSVAKFQSLKNMACDDGRVRGTMMYCAAKTGRFGGKGFQPHNLPREGFKYSDRLLKYINDHDVSNSDILTAFPGMSIGGIFSKLVRPMIYPSGNTELIAGDYASVESRGRSWLVGDEPLLKAFRDGVDNYKLAAMDIYGKDYADISPSERQVGKVVDLSCGYQGWVGAFQQMAKNYGVIISDEKAEQVIKSWRNKNPKIVDFWYELDACGLEAVKNPSKSITVRDIPVAISFLVRNDRLEISLPSGSVLTYWYPHIRQVENPYGKLKDTVCYWGISSQKERILEGNMTWGCLSSYGGKWSENINQAICRDVLCFGMLNLEAGGYPVIFNVHDEAIGEVEKGEKSLEEFCRLMSIVPSWAEGFPIKAEGWIGGRYRK